MNALLFLKNIGLFFMAPFIALAYLFALPVVGMYAILHSILTHLANKSSTVPCPETQD